MAEITKEKEYTPQEVKDYEGGVVSGFGKDPIVKECHEPTIRMDALTQTLSKLPKSSFSDGDICDKVVAAMDEAHPNGWVLFTSLNQKGSKFIRVDDKKARITKNIAHFRSDIPKIKRGRKKVNTAVENCEDRSQQARLREILSQVDKLVVEEEEKVKKANEEKRDDKKLLTKMDDNNNEVDEELMVNIEEDPVNNEDEEDNVAQDDDDGPPPPAAAEEAQDAAEVDEIDAANNDDAANNGNMADAPVQIVPVQALNNPMLEQLLGQDWQETCAVIGRGFDFMIVNNHIGTLIVLILTVRSIDDRGNANNRNICCRDEIWNKLNGIIPSCIVYRKRSNRKKSQATDKCVVIKGKKLMGPRGTLISLIERLLKPDGLVAFRRTINNLQNSAPAVFDRINQMLVAAGEAPLPQLAQPGGGGGDAEEVEAAAAQLAPEVHEEEVEVEEDHRSVQVILGREIVIEEEESDEESQVILGNDAHLLPPEVNNNNDLPSDDEEDEIIINDTGGGLASDATPNSPPLVNPKSPDGVDLDSVSGSPNLHRNNDRNEGGDDDSYAEYYNNNNKGGGGVRGNEVVLDGLENLKPHDGDVGGSLDEALLLPTTPTRTTTNGEGGRDSKEGIEPPASPKSSENPQGKKKVVKGEGKEAVKMEPEDPNRPRNSIDPVVFLGTENNEGKEIDVEAAFGADDPNDTGDDPPLDMDLVRQERDELNNKRQEMNNKRQEMNNKQGELNNEQDELNNKQGELVSDLLKEVERLKKVNADKEKNVTKLKKDVDDAKKEAEHWERQATEQHNEAKKQFEKAKKEKEKNIELRKEIKEMKKDDVECRNENLLEVVVDSMGDKSMLGSRAIANLIIRNIQKIMKLLKDTRQESNNEELVALLEGHLQRDKFLGFNSISKLIDRMLPELSTLGEELSDDEEENNNMLKRLLVEIMEEKVDGFDIDKKLSLDKWVSFLLGLSNKEMNTINQTRKYVQG